MHKLIWLTIIFSMIATGVSAQEPICGIGFMTSQKTAFNLKTCTIVEHDEQGMAEIVIHEYQVNPEGQQRIDFDSEVFLELMVAGLYDLYCTDIKGLKSDAAFGGECLQPGKPEILLE